MTLSLRKKRRYTPIYSKMQQRLQAEISYVKADDESILSYGEVTPYSVGRCHEVTEGDRPD